VPQFYREARSGFNFSASVCRCAAHLYGSAHEHPDRRPVYSSDMTDAEWEVTLAALPTPLWLEGRGGRPARYCERQLIDAVRYVDDSGCKWRQLPADFPPRSAVYAYFQRTAETGALAEYHDRLRDRVRESEGRAAEPTAAIIDSQSVPAAETVSAGHRGYDAGKNIDGRKRHIAVDTLGLLLACLVTPASVPDRDAAEPLLQFLHDQHAHVSLVWADGGYTGLLIEWALAALTLTVAVVKRADDTSGFTVLPRRWVVERTLSWICRRRRCVRDYERLPAHHLAMVTWSMTILMTRRLARRAGRSG
jgi:transposase